MINTRLFTEDYSDYPCNEYAEEYPSTSSAASAESQRYSGVSRLADGSAQCLECGRRFNSASSAQRHLALVHRGRDAPAEFECHVCSSRFKTVMYLRNHLRTAHGIYQRMIKPN